jgi:hypothetical protein
MKFLGVLGVLCGLTFSSAALDRHAFTFTGYDLNARIEPQQQRLGVRGKITLRNDSDAPQKNIVLQVSSTLNWASIQFEGKPADFVSQLYTSDIDHTGALTEAIVVLPRVVPPKQTVELEIGYEGVIPLDATRQTRIGAPADTAKHSDWDEISENFTAVRGIGYVAWYPIATEAVSLSEGNSVFDEVGRWKQRESGTEVRVKFLYEARDYIFDAGKGAHTSLLCNGPEQLVERDIVPGFEVDCRFLVTNTRAPLFVIGNYQEIDKPAIRTSYTREHRSGADYYALAVEQVAPLISKWFGDHRDTPATKAQIIDLPDANDAPFESGNMLLLPLTVDETTMLLSALRQITHLYFPSPRPWVGDGLAGYAQANYFLNEKGRDAALAYLQSHRATLVQTEKRNVTQGGERSAETSLINSPDEFYVQTKAMNVWWMLRDMAGDVALSAALHDYNPHEDTRADYLQKLVEAATHRDLEWFFDDWVYRDRGLPNLSITSVYPRELVLGGYMVTVTLENAGAAGAEVPVTAHMATGEATEKLIVPGKSKASVRIATPALPQEITANDGSVPESETTAHVYKMEAQ